MAKDKNEPTTETAAKREPKNGDSILLRLASGQFAVAVVDKVHKGGLVDLTANVNDQAVVITSSPRDDLGLRSDSWRFAD